MYRTKKVTNKARGEGKRECRLATRVLKVSMTFVMDAIKDSYY